MASPITKRPTTQKHHNLSVTEERKSKTHIVCGRTHMARQLAPLRLTSFAFLGVVWIGIIIFSFLKGFNIDQTLTCSDAIGHNVDWISFDDSLSANRCHPMS